MVRKERKTDQNQAVRPNCCSLNPALVHTKPCPPSLCGPPRAASSVSHPSIRGYERKRGDPAHIIMPELRREDDSRAGNVQVGSALLPVTLAFD
ncbi:hypothetical protein SRHO_G00183150 [Serrasalmus rhombeus]